MFMIFILKYLLQLAFGVVVQFLGLFCALIYQSPPLSHFCAPLPSVISCVCLS